MTYPILCSHEKHSDLKEHPEWQESLGESDRPDLTGMICPACSAWDRDNPKPKPKTFEERLQALEQGMVNLWNLMNQILGGG